MVKVMLKACGGTGIYEHEIGEIELDMCDFMLTIERSKGSSSYRLTADSEGNMIISSIDIESINLISENGYPALRIKSRK